jgi:multidrug efflux pump subunit AcrA (membrane-fusion protein)
VLALAVGGALVGRMLVTTHAWQRSSSGWEQLARTHGADLATAQEQLAAAQAELTDAQTQLATAQARITELADEKAQLGDTNAAQSQLADYQARVSQAAGTVATALAHCIDGQQNLIGYLEASDQYDPADLARYKADVTTVCGAATDANAALQRELSK